MNLRVLVRIFCGIAVLAILAVAAAAQDTPQEFWPEAQFYANLGDTFRLRAIGTRTKARESDKFTEATFEFDVDVGLKAMLRSKLAANPNTERGKYFTLRLGYVHVGALGDEENPSNEHRVIMELTPRYPLPAGFLLSDRSRGEAGGSTGASVSAIAIGLDSSATSPFDGSGLLRIPPGKCITTLVTASGIGTSTLSGPKCLFVGTRSLSSTLCART